LTQIAEYTVKRLALIALVFLFVLSVATPLIQPAKALTYTYTFNGPYNEASGGIYAPQPYCTVTIYFNDGNTPLFYYLGNNSIGVVNNTFTVSPATKPLYISYDITDFPSAGYNFHREYWLAPNENTGTFNVYIYPLLTTYVINFLDYTGQLQTYPYIEILRNINGAYQPVEKRVVDAQGSVVMNLLIGTSYRILYTDGITNTTYGDITTTSVTGIQLVLRGVDFTSLEAKKQLLLYQYVHAYAQRDFLNPDGAITVSYEDLTSKTTSFTITIVDTSDSSVAFSGTYTDQTFSYTWNNVPNATNYQVTIAINHQTFGLFNFTQYLPGEYTKASDPFSLAFLGSSMGISTAMLIPALLIIFVAGCFSELTSEVAAILTVIIAIVLSALGWINIGQGAIISALALAVMSGIIAAKRRMNVY
jgi:hypothetical protein